LAVKSGQFLELPSSFFKNFFLVAFEAKESSLFSIVASNHGQADFFSLSTYTTIKHMQDML